MNSWRMLEKFDLENLASKCKLYTAWSQTLFCFVFFKYLWETGSFYWKTDQLISVLTNTEQSFAVKRFVFGGIVCATQNLNHTIFCNFLKLTFQTFWIPGNEHSAETNFLNLKVECFCEMNQFAKPFYPLSQGHRRVWFIKTKNCRKILWHWLF